MHENRVPLEKKKNLVAETVKIFYDLITKGLAYVWDVHVWSEGYESKNRTDVYFAMKKMMKISEGEKVLEIGSGMPTYKEYSGETGQRGIFVALDLRLPIQQRARQILKKYEIECKDDPFLEKLLVANANHVPFADNSFSVVMANNYSNDSLPMLTEAVRVLVAGGRLGFSFSSQYKAMEAYKQYLDLGLKVAGHPERIPNSITWIFMAVKV